MHINSNIFTTQINVKTDFNFNIYLDLYAKSEEDNYICPPLKNLDKYDDNMYKYNGIQELPNYLYMKQKNNYFTNDSKYISSMNTISSINTLNNDYNKNIIKYGIKNNELKKRDLINNSDETTVNRILNTNTNDSIDSDILNDYCKNHYKFININITDTYEIEIQIEIPSDNNLQKEKLLLFPNVLIKNIIKENNNIIVISIDENKFLNIYLNNILVIDTNIKDYLINTPQNKEYYIKDIIINNTDNITDIYSWEYNNIKNLPIWDTKSIKINSENGIKCRSYKNRNIYFDFILEYFSKGVY